MMAGAGQFGAGLSCRSISVQCPSYLQAPLRGCRQVRGMNLTQYAQRLTVERARALLESTWLTQR